MNRLTTWQEWYDFAVQTLGHSEPEATEYANARELEERNRALIESTDPEPDA